MDTRFTAGLGGHFAGGEWRADANHNQILAITNGGAHATNALLTLHYDNGERSYETQQAIRPGDQMWVNFASLIRNRVPDRKGNVLPVDVNAGTYDVRDLTPGGDGLLENSLSLDTTLGYQANQLCPDCCGYEADSVSFNPYPAAVVVDGIDQTAIDAVNACSDDMSDISSYFVTWGSQNLGIAAVTARQVKGVAPGATTGTATGTIPTPGTCVCTLYSSQPAVPVRVFQVNNVTPYNLVLGGSGILTIYGTGFQSLFSPTVQFSPGSGITTGTPTIVSDTQMTVSYQVTCSSQVGSQNLQIGSSIDGGVSGTTWPENVVLPSAPTPTITFGGNTISGTQSVVVGQQVALSASYSLPTCTSVLTQSWSVPGTTVGGFNTGTTSGGATAAVITNPSTTFYWVTSGNSQQVTYTYSLSPGGGASSSVTFNVAGPSAPSVATALGTINVGNNKLEFGGSGTNIGILFTPSASAPSGYSNTWVYVQVIDGLTIQLSGGTSHTCTGSGLDNVYPYPPVTSTYTDDNPAVGLSTAYSEESYTMSAHMYVMWSSGLANSIPVPLGYVSWNWFGDAKYVSGAWSVQSSSSRSASAFQSSSSYPAWTTNYPRGSTCP